MRRGLSRLSWRVVARTFGAKNAYRQYASTGELKKTVLHDFHSENGGTLVPFCGWDMPLEYSGLSIKESHLHTREKASLFDVSHMLQLNITGPERTEFLESLTVSDLQLLKSFSCTYSLFTNEEGGIVDDTIITKDPKVKERFYVVVNAGCADKDLAHLKAQQAKSGYDVNIEVIGDHSLLALQGPKAAGVLDTLTSYDLADLRFLKSREMDISGIGQCRVTRCGYTGEDGFEISVPSDKAVQFAKVLLDHADVELAGLAVRDSLRLEAGLCLYGNDIDDTTSPIEAQLNWTIGKRRRAEGGFLGSDKVLDHLNNGVSKKLVGFKLEKGIARSHAKIVDGNDTEIGEVTSGAWSPSLSAGIGMGYVASEHAAVGSAINIAVRKKRFPGQVVSLPMVPNGYYKGKGK